jgi:diphthine-ammonia ligase
MICTSVAKVVNMKPLLWTVHCLKNELLCKKTHWNSEKEDKLIWLLNSEESETIIHSDDAFAQVAYLRFKKCRLEDKAPEDQSAIIQEWREFHAYEAIKDAVNNNTVVVKVPITSFNNEKDDEIKESIKVQGPILALGGVTASPSKSYKDIEEETEACMNAVQEKLVASGFKYDDVVSMNVLVSNMDDFARVNAVYKKFFDINPSPR